MKHKIPSLAVAASLPLALFTAPIALAEGSFSSTMANVAAGFDSREWQDKDSDTKGTSVSLRQCTTSNGQNSFKITLYKGKGLFSESRGGVTYHCAGNTWQDYNWGRQAAGTYHFQVTLVGGSKSRNVRGYAGGVNVYY